MRLNLYTLPRGKQYLYSFLIIILVSLVCFGLSGFLGYRVVALILLLTVSLIAITFDILPVLLAATLSAFIWDFFFIPPRFTIHVDTTEDTILLIMYFVIALINGVLTYKIRQIEKAARLKEERANSVKLYNTILDSLSHELRTPIATIIGATDNLQNNRNLNPENREQLIDEISKASFRLNQQVENLLNISRLESGHIKPKNDWCDIGELIYETVTRVEENGNNHKISISISNNLPLCWLDKGMLEQIVYNLLNNAVVHNDPNTKIAVSVACHIDLLEMIIEDDGRGFKDVEANDVFKKFSRDDQSRSKGRGLGLSIVKGFTEAMGGNVELMKSFEGGTRFTLTIPVKTSQLKIEHEQG
jgi:two-component system, OmpR family, sensor histidine kinase KdpD